MMVRSFFGTITASAVFGATFGFTGRVATAQTTSRERATESSSSVTTDTDTDTDTGALAPGRRDFSRYTTPGLCLAAAEGARDDARRTLATQVAMYREQGPIDTRDSAPVFHDTLPTTAVDIARTCGARFTPANTPARELGALFSLSLLQQNDGKASIVLDARLAGATTDSVRRVLLLDAMHAYLNADPARTAAAATVLTRLDAIPTARDVRIAAYGMWLRIAARAFDRESMRAEVERLLTVIGTPTDSEYTSYSGFVPEVRLRGYRQLMTLALADAPDSIDAVADRFIRDTRQTPAGVTWLTNRGISSTRDAVTALSPLDPPLDSLRGTVAPALQATRWFSPAKSTQGGRSAQPTTERAQWPIAGAVSLLLAIRSGSPVDPCHPELGGVLTHGGFWQSFLTPCYGLVLHIDDWTRRYAAQGLSTTVVIGSAGSVLLNGPQSFDEEAESVRKYVQDYLALPVTVAVQERPVTTRPAPDHRITRGIAPFATTYRGAVLVLTDAQGRVAYAGNDPVLLDAVLARLFRTQSTQSTQPTEHQ